MHVEAAGGIVLVVATVVALVWANPSPPRPGRCSSRGRRGRGLDRPATG
jgi:hypothetical protein